MPTTLTDVQLELQAVAHEFAEREIRPVAAHHDATEEFPRDVFLKAAEIGLTCFDIPEEYGGGGIDDLMTACLIAEELTWGDAAIGNLICSAGFFAGTVLELGTDAQKQRWVPPLCGPDPLLGALATTEPEAGLGRELRSRRTPRAPTDGYVLNGQKTWISNAGVAAFYLVFATVAPGHALEGHHGVRRRARRPRLRGRRRRWASSASAASRPRSSSCTTSRCPRTGASATRARASTA